MPHVEGHQPATWDTSPDESPIFQYRVKITQRDLDEIKHLVDRNFAGLTVSWLPAFIAVTKTLQQINDQDEDLDNYDSEGTCPTCKKPEADDID